ncbi:hypothetical protein AURDEDRAFT_127216 [Auricularia subglabra TFB-10046 SS5]|nr:hypothetical protein AURDEDRAFT_127216 [Auricularia subglabra TFB-10046 SS5]
MKSGTAATWASTVTQAMLDNKSSYSAFPDFLSDFALNFVLSDKKGDAANQIDGMEQGSRSIEDFITDFDSYTTLSGYSDYELQRKFKKGLNSRLLDQIYALDSAPLTMDALKKEALCLEQQWREHQSFRKTPTAPSSRAGGPAAPSAPARTPSAPAVP